MHLRGAEMVAAELDAAVAPRNRAWPHSSPRDFWRRGSHKRRRPLQLPKHRRLQRKNREAAGEEEEGNEGGERLVRIV